MPDSTDFKSNLVEYSVSELAFSLKRTVEDAYGHVRLRGEISGFRGQHASGHAYFTLKDEKAAIDAVCWRSTYGRLKFKPEEGLEVIATGKITTYPGRSKYQIVIEQLEPAGIGALMALLEERKKRLAAEGLFDEARKKPLPFLPRVIGVVTSPTGSVIRDILHRLEDRFPSHVIVWPVRVQGETSAAEVAAAIEAFNAVGAGGAFPRPDLLIVARGGGSLEDLWGFNEEEVARAAAASTIPLISAVGHETDWTLIDYIADHRAPTPTAAAERAVPVRADLSLQISGYGLRMLSHLRRGVEGHKSRFLAASRGIPKAAAILALPRQHFDAVAARLARGLGTNIHRARHSYMATATRLPRLSQLITAPRQHFDALARRLPPSLFANAREHRRHLERAARLRPHLLSGKLRTARDRLNVGSRDMARGLIAETKLKRRRLEEQAKLLSSLGPENVLARGFALVRDEAGTVVRSASRIHSGELLDIQLADGHVGARAEEAVADRKGGSSSRPEHSGPEAKAPTKPETAKSASKPSGKSPDKTPDKQGTLL
ncbi:exodeoxyribonuclease VII large subunit [Methyloligella sp. 2.7D]|uniref:exodeoxyribonuclease VII large subunit n=1 Tax=unclassified Methyloligella TaxID=2625955 RepID=UPI00157C2C2A|nr:exodeoxyribonuclease VII large subunit [Methyloligella sp. GL2]QKP78343.1 exodeoxyribonuclease VII large subunit [Methyloligella sp. GL2]